MGHSHLTGGELLLTGFSEEFSPKDAALMVDKVVGHGDHIVHSKTALLEPVSSFPIQVCLSAGEFFEEQASSANSGFKSGDS